MNPKLLFPNKLLISLDFVIFRLSEVKARIEWSSLSDGINRGPVG